MRIRLAAPALLLATLLLAGALPGAGAQAARESTHVPVFLHEFDDVYHVNPEQFAIPEGLLLELTVVNEDFNRYSHNLEFRALGVKTRDLEPGERETLWVEFPGPGTYVFESTTHAQDAPLGMRGEVIVLAKDGEASSQERESPALLPPLLLASLAAIALLRRRR